MNIIEVIKFLNENNGVISVIFSGIVMLATVIYAILTASLVKETKKMRELQTDARIEVVAKPLEESVNIIVLKVRNIGLGPAFDLKFNLYGVNNSEGEKLLVNEFSRSKFITKGLSYLGPGQEMESGYSQFSQSYEIKIKAKLVCVLTYTSHANKKNTLNIPINMEEFEGYGTIGTKPLFKIARGIESIERNLSQAITGFRKLNVNIFTSEDRKIKDEEELARYGHNDE